MLLGQLEAPFPQSAAEVTVGAVVKYLILPWLAVILLEQMGILKRVRWSEAFAPFPRERRRRRRRA